MLNRLTTPHKLTNNEYFNVIHLYLVYFFSIFRYILFTYIFNQIRIVVIPKINGYT